MRVMRYCRAGQAVQPVPVGSADAAHGKLQVATCQPASPPSAAARLMSSKRCAKRKANAAAQTAGTASTPRNAGAEVTHD